MEKLIENRGIIIFYLLVVVITLTLVNDVKREHLIQASNNQVTMLDSE